MITTRTTTCKYLNKSLEKPRKIKKVFSITIKKNKKKIFFHKILDLKRKWKDLLFTVESIIDYNSSVNEQNIRTKESTENEKNENMKL